MTDALNTNLSEIKTLLRILNTYGNTIVPSINGKQVNAQERLEYFVNKAIEEDGLNMEEIERLIA